MKTNGWLLAMVLSVFILSSCGSVAHVQKDETVDISQIKTYAWIEGTQGDSTNQKPNVNDLVDRKIRSSIEKNLALHGWRVNTKNPDVLLVYDVDVQKENKNVSNAVYSQPETKWFYNPTTRKYVPVYYPSQFMGYDNATKTIKEGTITLTMMNAKNDKTIWQGWTSSEVYGKRMTDKEIDENIKAIIKKIS